MWTTPPNAPDSKQYKAHEALVRFNETVVSGTPVFVDGWRHNTPATIGSAWQLADGRVVVRVEGEDGPLEISRVEAAPKKPRTRPWWCRRRVSSGFVKPKGPVPKPPTERR